MATQPASFWPAATVRRMLGTRLPLRHSLQELAMTDHVYKLTELVGTSPESVEHAIKNAIARAKRTVRNMRWFEVQQIRGHIEKGEVDHWQVILRVGFTLED
jgi:flavin-binding protein dodecin